MSGAQEDEVPRHVRPGNVLARKYRVEGVLGVGGMGYVLAATHVALGERVALKLLLPEAARHPDASARFLREARAAVRIKDEHVARVLDVDTLETGEAYMVMELLEGSDLATLVEQRGRLGVTTAVDCIVQACAALDEAHALGIIHRDLKPANLFSTLARDGTLLVKVVDFGISKSSDDASQVQTDTNAAMGSALYMSPEQMMSPKGVDHRTDVYSLGVTLFELLTGDAPFSAETVQALCAEVLHGKPASLATLRPDLPATLVAVVEAALSRDRDARPKSARALAAALAPFGSDASRALALRLQRGRDVTATPSFVHLPAAAGTPPSAQVTTLMHASLAHPVRPPGRRPLLAAGVLASVGLVVVAWAALSTRRDEPAPGALPIASAPPASASAPPIAPDVPVAAGPHEPSVAPSASSSAAASTSSAPASRAAGPRGKAPPPKAPPAAPSAPKSIYDGRR